MAVSSCRAGAAGFAALLGSLLLANPGTGQEPGREGQPPTGLRGVLGYSSRIEADTNRRLQADADGASLQTIHSFDAAILSQTRTQDFALRFGTDVRLSKLNGEDVSLSFDEPTYALDYSRESLNSLLGIEASYRRREIEFLEPFLLDDDGDTIIDEAGFSRSDGSVEELGFGVTLETGRTRPLGMTYGFNYRSRTFSENDDPSLYDSRDYRFSTTARLRFSEISTGRISTRLRQYTYENGRDADGEEYGVSLGWTRDLSQSLVLDVDAGYSASKLEEIIDGDVELDEESGLNTQVSLVKALPRGTLSGSLERTLSDGRFRTTLSFGRTLEFSGSQFGARAGISQQEDGDPNSIFELTYSRELADGAFRVSLERAVTANTVDEENLLTSLAVGYNMRIDNSSALSLAVDVAQIQSVTFEEGDERLEAALTAAYSRTLTRDWEMTVGYTGRANRVSDEDAISNAIFFTIGRDFIFRP